MPNFFINYSGYKEIEAFCSCRKGAKRVRVKGMDEFLQRKLNHPIGMTLMIITLVVMIMLVLRMPVQLPGDDAPI